jgi:hypothetical protein
MAKLINPPKTTAANVPTDKIVTIGTIVREFAPPRDQQPTVDAFRNLVELLSKKPMGADPPHPPCPWTKCKIATYLGYK